ncbi:MAG: hypothetical protein JXQ83_14105 [Candidatus Glassbacteria bacterium]|nr:hypothetical protein [Candidatus Glassbacteria bacterium]
MSRTDKYSQRKVLPAAYRRWPLLAGVAAGLWVLVLFYLGRMLVTLWQGHGKAAAFSLLWSLVCLALWSLLHRWARNRPTG